VELTLIRAMGWSYEDLDRTSAERVLNTLQMLGAESAVRRQKERNRRMGRRR
jgi:hypothetical protein